MKCDKFEIIERKMLFNGKEIKDGDFIIFNYGKRGLQYGGFFYIADIVNRLFGYDFMISEKLMENWKWKDGYLAGFKLSKVYNFKIIKEKQ